MKSPESQQLETQNNQRLDKFSDRQDVYENLNQFMSVEQKDKKTVLETRDILGNSANNLTDEQICSLVSEIQYLIDTWLEEFERKIYGGRTLNELLNPTLHGHTASRN